MGQGMQCCVVLMWSVEGRRNTQHIDTKKACRCVDRITYVGWRLEGELSVVVREVMEVGRSR